MKKLLTPFLVHLKVLRRPLVYDYIVQKTEAMWIGSQRGCEVQPFGVKWQTCDKFLRIHITYGVKLLIEKNFKQTLKIITNTINLWKVRQRAVHLP